MYEIKKLVDGNEYRTYSIHYSCSGFYHGGVIAPTICCIALVNMNTKELHSFSLQDYITDGKNLIDAEKMLLTNFVDFYKNLKNPILVHWYMNSLEFGFKAILSRCENFGIYDLNFPNTDTIDLREELDKSLENSLADIYCLSPMFLRGRDEAECFNQRSFNLVKLSTESKAAGIMKLFEKYLNREILPYLE